MDNYDKLFLEGRIFVKYSSMTISLYRCIKSSKDIKYQTYTTSNNILINIMYNKKITFYDAADYLFKESKQRLDMIVSSELQKFIKELKPLSLFPVPYYNSRNNQYMFKSDSEVSELLDDIYLNMLNYIPNYESKYLDIEEDLRLLWLKNIHKLRPAVDDIIGLINTDSNIFYKAGSCNIIRVGHKIYDKDGSTNIEYSNISISYEDIIESAIKSNITFDYLLYYDYDQTYNQINLSHMSDVIINYLSNVIDFEIYNPKFLLLDNILTDL